MYFFQKRVFGNELRRLQKCFFFRGPAVYFILSTPSIAWVAAFCCGLRKGVMAHGSISVPFVGHKRLDKRKPKQTEALQNDATKWYLKHAPKKRFIVTLSLTSWRVFHAFKLKKPFPNDFRLEYGAWKEAITLVTMRKYDDFYEWCDFPQFLLCLFWFSKRP